MNETVRPAFYALAPGSWRDYVTLLHPPYTAWHLSYVAIGAAIAPRWRPGILGLALLAFFLGMGIAAHALDELRGRPLQTRIGAKTLVALATVSLAAAAGIGIGTAFIAVAYNLELLGGRFHNGLWFALAWGALPVLATFFAAASALRIEAVLAAGAAALLSYVQRVLSTPVRLVRRHVRAVSGRIELSDGTELPVTPEALAAQPELALRVLSGAMVMLALALVLMRVT